MTILNLTCRAAMLGTIALMSALFAPAMAQDRPTLRFSAIFSAQDIRAEMMELLSAQVADDATIEPYFGGTQCRQGTELVALQRGNLEIGNIAPQDISNQIPEWSLLTSAYLFRDADHLRTFFDSDVGATYKQMAEDQLGIHILGPTYFGTRQVGLRLDKKVQTPADLDGVKLRMPGGDAWQFLGAALGANPTPMDYAEVYTGLQAGAIDGQDNPLPNVENMKFYEVMDQIVLTSHLIGYDLLVISKSAWDAMDADQRAEFEAAAKVAIDFSQEEHLERELELVERFESAGLKVYEPNRDAFRAYAQDMYLNSDISASWPEGALEAIDRL